MFARRRQRPACIFVTRVSLTWSSFPWRVNYKVEPTIPSLAKRNRWIVQIRSRELSETKPSRLHAPLLMGLPGTCIFLVRSKNKWKKRETERKRAPRMERVPRDRSAIHLRLSSPGKKVRNLVSIHGGRTRVCVWRAIKVTLTNDGAQSRERERKKERADLWMTFFSLGMIEIDVLCN